METYQISNTLALSTAPPAVQINPSQYADDPEPIAKGPGGCPADDLVQSLAIHCHRSDDPTKANMFCCMGTLTGCTTAWKGKGGVKMPVMSHAAMCEHVLSSLREKLDGGLAMQASSAKILASNGSGSTTKKSIPWLVPWFEAALAQDELLIPLNPPSSHW